MRLTRLKSQTQGHPFPQQMLLANHLAQSFGPQALGQWLLCGGVLSRGLCH
jgi:hypothetical protein